MADDSPRPGSRAIKIPVSKLDDDSYISQCRRSNTKNVMQRTDSTEGTGSSSDTNTSTIMSTPRLKTSKPVISPPDLQYSAMQTEGPSQRKKEKQRAHDSPPAVISARAMTSSYSSPLSPSMLSSSSYKSINLNTSARSDEPPRIITYTKHSQGFTWNDELFLPSYLVGRRYRSSKARRRWADDDDMDLEDDDVPFDEDTDKCPVMDIFVTDEEAANMLP